ncbi:helix-turn-helix domain-containing protein [Scytonema sp. UIC 10036]|uniref:helix-turn-helix domain-containing protein n=1 Tax=Scytonema sp. UIC 10036 TaxID=2304196 RepID=UPI0012DAE03E|nr:helix-turn-helix domain-containing protein [Scytonema sp. UIC 10036]MUH00366.1 helix-turn-helix domain-containing protein [Scytonema sp. UIC 10036]
MNKQEAAEFLGVSVRALERYVQQGKISVRYEKGKTRPTANFDETELKAFKEELYQPKHKPAVEARQNTTGKHGQKDTAFYQDEEGASFDEDPSDEVRQITTIEHDQQDTVVYQSGEIAEFGESPSVIERLSAVIETLLARTGEDTRVRVSEKLLLTIAEAQELTGLPRQVLRDAINEGKLKAKVIGRSWRIKRSDLQEFVDKLF